MSGSLTTHALDTARGRPASGMELDLFRVSANGDREHLKSVRLNEDGRSGEPLLEGEEFVRGVYEIVFRVGGYFGPGGEAAGPAFLDLVPVRFGVADPDAHYHVPLLVSPWSYTTYRGS